MSILKCSNCGKTLEKIGKFTGNPIWDQWMGNFCRNCNRVFCGSCIKLGGPTPCPKCGTPTTVAAVGFVQGLVERSPKPPINNWALASFILSLCSLCGGILAGIPATTMGFIALRKIDKAEGQARGKGLAWTGIVLGFITSALSICLVLVSVMANIMPAPTATSTLTPVPPTSAVMTTPSAAAVEVPSIAAKSPMPTPRMAAACAVTGGKIYVIGGLDNRGGVSSVIEEYDPSTDTWNNKAAMPTPRVAASAVAIGEKIYVLGGKNEGGVTDIVEVYDVVSNSWAKATELPEARWNHMVAELEGKIYVIGGIVGTGNNRRSINTVDVYDPMENSWSTGQALPMPKQGAAIVVIQGRIYILGGRTGAGASGYATNTVEVYDTFTGLWSSLTPMQESRTGAQAIGLDGKIYMIGGAAGGESTDSIEMYDPTTEIWTMFALTLQKPRTSHCVASVGNRIYIIGGATEESLAGIVGMVEELTVK